MSVEETEVVDFIGTERSTGSVVLTVSDHLRWDEESDRHLNMLQDKLNTYLRFVESGEILSAYPGSKGRPVTIEVVGKVELPPIAQRFLDAARDAIRDAGFDLRFKLLISSSSA